MYEISENERPYFSDWKTLQFNIRMKMELNAYRIQFHPAITFTQTFVCFHIWAHEKSVDTHRFNHLLCWLTGYIEKKKRLLTTSIVSYMVLWFVCWRIWCKKKSMDSNFTMNSIIFRYFNLGCHPAPFPSYRKQITEIVRNTLCRVKAESDESDRITCICYETVLCYTMSINIIHYWSKSF